MRVYRFEEPIEDSLRPREPLGTPPAVPRGSGGGRRWIAIVAAGVGALVVVAAIGVWALGRPIEGYPDGTSVDGVDISEMTRPEALAVVRDHGQAVIDRGVTVTYNGKLFAFDPVTLDLQPRVERALNTADRELGFVDRVRVRLGRYEERDIPLLFGFDQRAFARSMVPVRQAINTEPVSATVEVVGRDVRVTPGIDGVTAVGPELRRTLRLLSRTEPTIEVPVRITEPEITTAEAERAAADARTYIRTPHVTVLGKDRRRIPPSVVRNSTGFDARGGRLVFVVKQAIYRAYFGAAYRDREKAPRNAIFTTNGQGGVRIIAGKNGRGVNVPALAAALQKDPGLRVIPIELGPREPDLTTKEARELGVTRVVSEFRTAYSGGSRVTNIRRAAEILDQYIIPKGGTFSLNDALGQRTQDRGFVLAPMIGANNVLVDDVGGGVSQVATTVFNAAFFAGLKIIDHTPHSFWISRYPMGREATVSWRSPELIFQNNWDAPVVILTRTDDTGITVLFLSAPLGRKVEVFEGEPRNFTRPTTVRIEDKELPPGTEKVEQTAGEGGFTIDYGRIVFQNGKRLWKDEYTWRYSPQNAVIRFNPEPLPVPEEEGTTTGEDGLPIDGGEGVVIEEGGEEIVVE